MVDHTRRLSGHPLRPGGDRAVVGLVLHGDAVADQLAVGAHAQVVVAVPLGEAPLARGDDLQFPK